MSASTRHYDGAYPAEQLVRKATRAGYHSHQNERIHLEACNDAAAIAMCIMKNGGSAIDAIEAAIKLLEDREITNAGYGSNLAMDGVVECDASVVDHYGRSGAVGAVAQIKNPISLARMVYEHTSKPLTLRRVPPNLLCAQGATEFAAELGMPVLPHDALISPAAKERWLRWRADLRSAERKAKKAGQHPSCYRLRADIASEDETEHRQLRQRHTANLLRGYPSLLQSPSPEPSDESLYYSTENTSSTPSEPVALSKRPSGSWLSDHRIREPDASASSPGPVDLGPAAAIDSSRSAFVNSTQKVPTLSQFEAAWTASSDRISEDAEMEDVSRMLKNGPTARKTWGDCSGEESDSAESTKTIMAPQSATSSTSVANNNHDESSRVEDAPTNVKSTMSYTQKSCPLSKTDRPDHITDTVGAIAIDSWGRIACGASSGGIGMKYRGRVGPAALVGVGAAVIPLDPDDDEQVSVATVTSGTGEHMATTMAATTCAERLYQSVKKGRGGEYAEVTEDEALRSMIENEFMGHSSVKNSNSAGAIGILGVKKLRTGIMLFYGHNTDSFALASMSSDDDVPKCTMSRSNGNGQIAQGGRLMSYKTRKRSKVTPRQRQFA
ncbi:hypothetical protein N0V95_002111 [Ascochyta clinopodiicola]|nr:hypothetical protein N0V95_002111 [Ascochyta clinopodiicola]